MINTTINIELKNIDGEGKEVATTIPVLLQEASPIKVADIFAENITSNGKVLKNGGFLQDCMGVVIMHPKDLIDKINESENAFEVIGTLASEVRDFCNNPRLYILKKKEQSEGEGTEQPPVLGESTPQPNPNGNEATNA
jgi:hypothetical protein